MANPTDFYNAFNTHIKQLITDLETLKTDRDKLNADASLPGQAASVANAKGAIGLVAQDFTNAASAIDQILFAFNSGSPTQASLLYKVI